MKRQTACFPKEPVVRLVSFSFWRTFVVFGAAFAFFGARLWHLFTFLARAARVRHKAIVSVVLRAQVPAILVVLRAQVPAIVSSSCSGAQVPAYSDLLAFVLLPTNSFDCFDRFGFDSREDLHV
jgi:hypothetical protein